MPGASRSGSRRRRKQWRWRASPDSSQDHHRLLVLRNLGSRHGRLNSRSEWLTIPAVHGSCSKYPQDKHGHGCVQGVSCVVARVSLATARWR